MLCPWRLAIVLVGSSRLQLGKRTKTSWAEVSDLRVPRRDLRAEGFLRVNGRTFFGSRLHFFNMTITKMLEWKTLPVALTELCLATTLRCGQSFRYGDKPLQYFYLY
jgi:hypothetical protein